MSIQKTQINAPKEVAKLIKEKTDSP